MKLIFGGFEGSGTTLATTTSDAWKLKYRKQGRDVQAGIGTDHDPEANEVTRKDEPSVRTLKVSDLESLSGVDMRHLYLSFANFSNMNLRHTNFEGCRLNCGVLDGSDLTGANLRNTDLRQASFRGANLEGAHFEKAIAAEANFEDAQGLSRETRKYLKSRGAHGL